MVIDLNSCTESFERGARLKELKNTMTVEP